MDEARLERTPGGLAPATDGWFVVNARDAVWLENDAFGARCGFETDGRIARAYGLEERHFPQLGLKLEVVDPGQVATLYHAETQQEDFLVLSGEGLAVIEDEERRLRAWDLVHCPPGTRHTFVNDGTEPLVMLATGARREDGEIVYAVSDVAARHGASVEVETDEPREAYASHPHWRVGAKPRL